LTVPFAIFRWSVTRLIPILAAASFVEQFFMLGR
jgi:hypothetical protein